MITIAKGLSIRASAGAIPVFLSLNSIHLIGCSLSYDLGVVICRL